MDMNRKAQIGIIVFVLICVISMIFSITYLIRWALLPVRTVTTQIDSAGNIIDKTYDADNAVYNYEWFKMQYEKIQANRNQIQVMIDSLAEFKQTYGGNATDWDYETKQEYNRLNTIKIGLMNQEENLVAEYNARSKMANREIFQDKLPLSVDKMLW